MTGLTEKVTDLEPVALDAFPGARVLLIGTGSYAADSSLPDVPAVGSSLADLRTVLLARCGLAESTIRVVLDPPTAQVMGEAVAEAADQAEDLLLLYYIGHGLVSNDGALHLAARQSEGFRVDRRISRVEVTSLPYAHVRNLILTSAARSRVVVLDCCFSGRARDGLAGPGDEVADLTQVAGGFVLTSAGSDELAMAPPRARHTAFTGALLRLLLDGDPDGPPMLTLQHVHRHLASALPANGFARPRQRSDGRIGELVVAANGAHRAARPTERARRRPNRTAVCPYLGLVPFDETDEAYFYGRQALVNRLVRRVADRVDDPRPLLVTGASGAGKSSVLRAGLLPSIARGDLGIPGSSGWRRIILSPTATPVEALAAHLSTLIPGAAAGRIADGIRGGGTLLTGILREVGAAGAGRTIWIIDQFEEAFTLCGVEPDRAAFIRALATLASGADDVPPTLVVIAVRSDFYGRCVSFPSLTSALEGEQVVVSAMTAAQTRAAVEEPARLAGVAVAPGLVDLLLADLGADAFDGGAEGAYESGRLPLLAHALRQTWTHRDGGDLSVDAYRRSGGIRRGLALAAERVYGDLDPADREMALRLLTRLVRLGDGEDDTRRHVPIEQLNREFGGSSAASAVLAAFAADDARLITIDGDSVALTHEALIRAWPRLQQWLGQDRAGLLVAQQMADAAAEWDSHDRDASMLYSGARLTVARQWATDSRRAEVSGIAAEFLAASVEQDAKRILREAAAQTAARRRARRDRILASVLGGLLVVAVVAGAVAVVQARRARDSEQTAVAQQRTAIARGLTIEADPLQATQPVLALRLAVAADAIGRDLRSAGQLADSMAGGVPIARVPTATNAEAPEVTFAQAGGIVVLNYSDRVELWDITDLGLPRRIASMSAELWTVDVSADGRVVAVQPMEGRPTLWNISSKGLGSRAGINEYGGFRVVLSPTGELAALLVGESVQLWSIADQDRPRRLSTFHVDQLSDLAFSPDAHALTTISDLEAEDGAEPVDRPPQIWDITTAQRPRRAAELKGPAISQMEFGSSGRMLVTAGDEILVWAVEQGRKPRRLAQLNIDHPSDVAISPDERTIVAATGGVDNSAVVFDVSKPQTPRKIATIVGHKGAVQNVAYAPDGRMLATSSDDSVWLRRIAPATAVERNVVGEACQLAGGGLTQDQWDDYIPGLPYRPTCP